MTDALKAIETRYKDHRFRSRTEARWAVFFDNARIRYSYELEGFELPSGRYLPDFWLPDISKWFEVKGDKPTAEEIGRCQELADASGFEVILAIGVPEAAEQLLRFLPNEEHDGVLWYFADDRRNEGEFWLVSDGAASSIGPVAGEDHGKYPLVHSATAAGYAAAKAARFEHGEQG